MRFFVVPWVCILCVFSIEKVAAVVQVEFQLRDVNCEPFCEDGFSSCAEIKQQFPDAVSGIYQIDTNVGRLGVYCEMALGGGGFTFLPRQVVKRNSRLDLSSIIGDKSQVLLRYQASDSTQPYTVVRQLDPYGRYIPLSLQLNSHVNYTATQNERRMGPFLFLGIIPSHVASTRTRQGFRSNSQELTFMNCDANPNSYFAFFPNHREVSPTTSSFSRYAGALVVNWMSSARPVVSHRTMPNDFFFFAEMHFGGCGAYWESGSHSSATYGRRVEGVAVGFH